MELVWVVPVYQALDFYLEQVCTKESKMWSRSKLKKKKKKICIWMLYMWQRWVDGVGFVLQVNKTHSCSAGLGGVSPAQAKAAKYGNHTDVKILNVKYR